jgi:hypothetical protein
MNFENIKHLVHYKEVLLRYIKIMILQEILLLKLVMHTVYKNEIYDTY